MTEQGENNLKHLKDIGFKLEKIKDSYYYVYGRGLVYNDKVDERRVIDVDDMESIKLDIDFIYKYKDKDDIRVMCVPKSDAFLIGINNSLVTYNIGYYYPIKKVLEVTRVNDHTVILRTLIVGKSYIKSSDKYIVDMIIYHVDDDVDNFKIMFAKGGTKPDKDMLLIAGLSSRQSVIKSIIVSANDSDKSCIIKHDEDSSIIYNYISHFSEESIFLNEPTTAKNGYVLDKNGRLEIAKDKSYYKIINQV